MRPNLRRSQFQFRTCPRQVIRASGFQHLFPGYLFAIGRCGCAGRTTKLNMVQIDRNSGHFDFAQNAVRGSIGCVATRPTQRRSSAAAGGNGLYLNQSHTGDTKPSMRRDVFLKNVEMDGKKQ